MTKNYPEIPFFEKKLKMSEVSASLSLHLVPSESAVSTTVCSVGGFWVSLVQKVYSLLMNFKCLSCQYFVRVGTTPTA